MGHTVHAFLDTDEFLGRMAELPFPGAVVMNLSLKGTRNGFQVGETIRELPPEISAKRFIFTSGWKKQYVPLTAEVFRDIEIIDKDNWQLEELLAALNHANSQGGVS